MLASISSLDLLHDLVHAVVRDDARVAAEMDAGLVRDAAMGHGLHITLCSPSLLTGTGALFAFVASSPAADIAPAIQDAAAADRLALVAWPRRSGDDEASAAIARALGLIPLVAARDDDGVHLDHPTTHPDSPLHVAVRPALLGHGRSSAPVEDAPADAWRGAAQAYLALGLYGAARAAARRAGEAGDSTTQHANRLADIDTALASALATSAAPLLPVLSGGLGHKVMPLLRAEGNAREAATFGRYLDEEVLGNGVEVIARHFLRMAMGDKATLLDLAPDHGHLAVALADAVGMWRVVIAGGAAHHALRRSLAPLPNTLRPAVHATTEDAVLAAIESGAPSIVVHATLATVVDGTLAGAVVALRARRADFVVVVSGVKAAVIEADETVAATRRLATQLGLTVRGVGIQKGRLVVDELDALPRAQLLLVC
jgi:hypothetical protein